MVLGEPYAMYPGHALSTAKAPVHGSAYTKLAYLRALRLATRQVKAEYRRPDGPLIDEVLKERPFPARSDAGESHSYRVSGDVTISKRAQADKAQIDQHISLGFRNVLEDCRLQDADGSMRAIWPSWREAGGVGKVSASKAASSGKSDGMRG